MSLELFTLFSKARACFNHGIAEVNGLKLAPNSIARIYEPEHTRLARLTEYLCNGFKQLDSSLIFLRNRIVW